MSAASEVTTWANGFGIWHARVSHSGAMDKATMARLRARARRAIRREIAARVNVGPGWRCPVEVKARDTESITFGEKVNP